MMPLSKTELTISLQINDDLINILKLFIAAGASETDEEKLERLDTAMNVFKNWPRNGVPEVKLTEAE